MSYDVGMVIDSGGEHPASVGDSLNHTSNTSGMWALALGCGLHELHDKTGAECIPLLREAIETMRSNPRPFREMNPPNGWGSYETALMFLVDILLLCLRHPLAKVRVWR